VTALSILCVVLAVFVAVFLLGYAWSRIIEWREGRNL